MINIAVILLSGSGNRFNSTVPKQFAMINGSPLFSYSLNSFLNNNLIDEIILVVNPLFFQEVNNYITKSPSIKKAINIIKGGETRQLSSFLGVLEIKDQNSKILIHDAVRPFISQRIITDCINKLDEYNAVSTTIPVSDTIYIKDENDLITEIPDRNKFLRAQTPQGFKYETILLAHQLAQKDGILNAPDDCYLINKYNLGDIGIIDGDVNNIKITFPLDNDLAEIILNKYYDPEK